MGGVPEGNLSVSSSSLGGGEMKRIEGSSSPGPLCPSPEKCVRTESPPTSDYSFSSTFNVPTTIHAANNNGISIQPSSSCSLSFPSRLENTDDAAIFVFDTMDPTTAKMLTNSPSALAVLTPQRHVLLPHSSSSSRLLLPSMPDFSEYDEDHIGILSCTRRTPCKVVTEEKRGLSLRSSSLSSSPMHTKECQSGSHPRPPDVQEKQVGKGGVGGHQTTRSFLTPLTGLRALEVFDRRGRKKCGGSQSKSPLEEEEDGGGGALGPGMLVDITRHNPSVSPEHSCASHECVTEDRDVDQGEEYSTRSRSRRKGGSPNHFPSHMTTGSEGVGVGGCNEEELCPGSSRGRSCGDDFPQEQQNMTETPKTVRDDHSSHHDDDNDNAKEEVMLREESGPVQRSLDPHSNDHDNSSGVTGGVSPSVGKTPTSTKAHLSLSFLVTPSAQRKNRSRAAAAHYHLHHPPHHASTFSPRVSPQQEGDRPQNEVSSFSSLPGIGVARGLVLQPSPSPRRPTPLSGKKMHLVGGGHSSTNDDNEAETRYVPLLEFEKVRKERNRLEKMYEHQKAMYIEMRERHQRVYQLYQEQILEKIALSSRLEVCKSVIQQHRRCSMASRSAIISKENEVVLELKTKKELIREKEEYREKYERLLSDHTSKLAGLESLYHDLYGIMLMSEKDQEDGSSFSLPPAQVSKFLQSLPSHPPPPFSSSSSSGTTRLISNEPYSSEMRKSRSRLTHMEERMDMSIGSREKEKEELGGREGEHGVVGDGGHDNGGWRGSRKRIHISQLDALLKASYTKTTSLVRELLLQRKEYEALWEEKKQTDLQLLLKQKEAHERERRWMSVLPQRDREYERLHEENEELKENILNMRQLLIRTMDPHLSPRTCSTSCSSCTCSNRSSSTSSVSRTNSGGDSRGLAGDVVSTEEVEEYSLLASRSDCRRDGSSGSSSGHKEERGSSSDYHYKNMNNNSVNPTVKTNKRSTTPDSSRSSTFGMKDGEDGTRMREGCLPGQAEAFLFPSSPFQSPPTTALSTPRPSSILLYTDGHVEESVGSHLPGSSSPVHLPSPPQAAPPLFTSSRRAKKRMRRGERRNCTLEEGSQFLLAEDEEEQGGSGERNEKEQYNNKGGATSFPRCYYADPSARNNSNTGMSDPQEITRRRRREEQQEQERNQEKEDGGSGGGSSLRHALTPLPTPVIMGCSMCREKEDPMRSSGSDPLLTTGTASSTSTQASSDGDVERDKGEEEDGCRTVPPSSLIPPSSRLFYSTLQWKEEESTRKNGKEEVVVQEEEGKEGGGERVSAVVGEAERVELQPASGVTGKKWMKTGAKGKIEEEEAILLDEDTLKRRHPVTHSPPAFLLPPSSFSSSSSASKLLLSSPPPPLPSSSIHLLPPSVSSSLPSPLTSLGKLKPISLRAGKEKQHPQQDKEKKGSGKEEAISLLVHPEAALMEKLEKEMTGGASNRTSPLRVLSPPSPPSSSASSSSLYRSSRRDTQPPTVDHSTSRTSPPENTEGMMNNSHHNTNNIRNRVESSPPLGVHEAAVSFEMNERTPLDQSKSSGRAKEGKSGAGVGRREMIKEERKVLLCSDEVPRRGDHLISATTTTNNNNNRRVSTSTTRLPVGQLTTPLFPNGKRIEGMERKMEEVHEKKETWAEKMVRSTGMDLLPRCEPPPPHQPPPPTPRISSPQEQFSPSSVMAMGNDEHRKDKETKTNLSASGGVGGIPSSVADLFREPALATMSSTSFGNGKILSFSSSSFVPTVPSSSSSSPSSSSSSSPILFPRKN